MKGLNCSYRYIIEYIKFALHTMECLFLKIYQDLITCLIVVSQFDNCYLWTYLLFTIWNIFHLINGNVIVHKSLITQSSAQLNLEKNYDSNFGSKNIQKISYDRKLVITEIFLNVCPHTNVVTANFSSGKLLCKKTSKSWKLVERILLIGRRFLTFA